MKKILFFIVSLIPLLAFAQDKEEVQDMSKYLVGAVPVVDGKVVFSREFIAPGLSKEEIFNINMAWIENTLKENKNKSGIVYSDSTKGTIAGISEHHLVFKSSAFSLDRATVTYRIILTAENGECKMEISGIKYLYDGSQKNIPDRYNAEEWITDEFALNKTKTKIAYGAGKFRTKTIDKVDELAASLQKALEAAIINKAKIQSPPQTVYVRSAQQSNVPMTVVQQNPAQEATSANSTTTANTAAVAATIISNATNATQNKEMEGYKNISPDKIPGNIIKMLSEDWMLITAGNDAKFNTMTASWGGLGVLFNKPVAICFINPARYTYQLMESNDTYTLTFYTEAYRDALDYCGKVSGRDTDKIKGSGLTPITTPDGSKAFSQAWMIIECRKLVSQSLSLDAINNAAEREKRGAQPMHKMYIGEILNVWVK